MIYRQWYAQLDIFDTMRRYLAIVFNWQSQSLSRDRLFISDFYLVNPHLLHYTHMTMQVRRAFVSLQIAKPEVFFLKYPSPPMLFNKMKGIQMQALHNLVGRGLFEIKKLREDQYVLSATGRGVAEGMGGNLVLSKEEGLLWFLTTEFSTIGRESGGLRSATGLRRTGI